MEDIGRPSYLKLDEKGFLIVDGKLEEFFKIVSLGNYIDFACDHSGISDTTINDYNKTGKEDLKKGLNTKYAQFSVLLKKAQSDGKLFHISKIHSAKDWKASAWFLERTDKRFRLNNVSDDEIESNSVQVILGSKKDDSNK